MLRKLKRVEMDFSMTTQEPIEQVKAMEVVFMTLLMMIQTTICRTLTTVKVSLQVEVWDHVLLTRRMPHRCPGKPSSTINISAGNMTNPAKRQPWRSNHSNHHAQIASQDVRVRSLQMHWLSWQRLSHWNPSTAIQSPPCRPLIAHNETTGNNQSKRNAHRSCTMTHSQHSTAGKQGNCESSQLAPDGSTGWNATLMAPYDTKHT